MTKIQRVYTDLKDRLSGGTKGLRKGRGLTLVDASSGPASGGWFAGLFGGAREESTAAAAAAAKVAGLYMYGGVGVGKTMLMDLLAASAPPYFQVPGACVWGVGVWQRG